MKGNTHDDEQLLVVAFLNSVSFEDNSCIFLRLSELPDPLPYLLPTLHPELSRFSPGAGQIVRCLFVTPLVLYRRPDESGEETHYTRLRRFMNYPRP